MHSTSAFPTLDLLEVYGLRSAFMLLIFAARSGSEFQKLHDEVIPGNCRLPRSRFIDLKHERTRFLGNEEQVVVMDQRLVPRPSHEVILREFNAARTDPMSRHRQGSRPTLLGYYESLLRHHSEKGLLLPGGLSKHEARFHRSSPGLPTEWLACTLSNVPGGLSIAIVKNIEEAPADCEVSVPTGFTAVRVRTVMHARVKIVEADIDLESTERLLEQPPCTHLNTSSGVWYLYYELGLPTTFKGPEPSNQLIEVDERSADDLLAHLVAHGIDIKRIGTF